MSEELLPCHEARAAVRNINVPQTQEPLNDQLDAMEYAADKLGLYDAADYLRCRRAPSPDKPCCAKEPCRGPNHDAHLIPCEFTTKPPTPPSEER